MPSRWLNHCMTLTSRHIHRWAFRMVYKTQSTKVSRSDLYLLKQNYNKHVMESNINILKLIEVCDANKNNALDKDELRILLSVMWNLH